MWILKKKCLISILQAMRESDNIPTILLIYDLILKLKAYLLPDIYYLSTLYQEALGSAEITKKKVTRPSCPQEVQGLVQPCLRGIMWATFVIIKILIPTLKKMKRNTLN